MLCLLYANQKAVSDMRPGLCLALVKDQLSNTLPVGATNIELMRIARGR